MIEPTFLVKATGVLIVAALVLKCWCANRKERLCREEGIPLALTEGLQLDREERMLFGDEADAHAFWKDKEWKTFAVDLIMHQGNKPKLLHTMYVRARTGAVAAVCTKANDMQRKPRARYVARFAGPREHLAYARSAGSKLCRQDHSRSILLDCGRTSGATFEIE